MSSRRKSQKSSGVSRNAAAKLATSKMYTAVGESIRNLDAYVAAGGIAHNSAGDPIKNPKAYRNAIEASFRQNTQDPKYLYHYTNEAAAASISESRKVQASDSGLAGPGTYCTTKPPRCHTNTLLSNNYGSPTLRDASYVDRYVRIDADRVPAQQVSDGSRNIWKVDGNVHLDQHNSFIADRNQSSYSDQQYYDQSYDDAVENTGQEYDDDYDGGVGHQVDDYGDSGYNQDDYFY